MKKTLLILLSSLSLLAIELPQTIQTTVQSISKNKQIATLAQDIPKGMSGIVIHNYGNNLSAITHTLISQGSQKATIQNHTTLNHATLPNIKNSVQKGDKVVFGNLYNNLLLIAPNEQIYSQITQKIEKNWIHPDLYAIYLIRKEQSRLSLDNLRNFAIETQVGLVLIVTQNSLILLDPISKSILKKEPFNGMVKQANSPFYARFGQISNNFFGAESQQNFSEYYRGVEEIR